MTPFRQTDRKPKKPIYLSDFSRHHRSYLQERDAAMDETRDKYEPLKRLHEAREPGGRADAPEVRRTADFEQRMALYHSGQTSEAVRARVLAEARQNDLQRTMKSTDLTGGRELPWQVQQKLKEAERDGKKRDDQGRQDERAEPSRKQDVEKKDRNWIMSDKAREKLQHVKEQERAGRDQDRDRDMSGR